MSLPDLLDAESAAAEPPLVLNADDPAHAANAFALEQPAVWYSEDPENALVLGGVAEHGYGAVTCGGHILVAVDGVWCDCGALARMPLTMGGSTRTHVPALLAAALAALSAGHDLADVHQMLATRTSL